MQIKWRQQLSLWSYIILICALLRAGFFYLNLHAILIIPDTNTTEDKHGFLFQVSPGSSFTQVATQLKNSGLLSQTRDLSLYARFSGKAGQIKAGEYFLNQGMTALSFLDKLVAGEVNYHQLVLLEGWTLRQALAAIQANPNIIATLALNSPSTDKLNNTLQEKLSFNFYPEGMFFPDTYNFTKGTTDLEILQRAQALLEQVLEEEWTKRDVGLPYASPYEALIMASIIEKETAQAQEREQIAGVFVRRLQQNMRLQTDPTVIYGLADSYDGNLTRAQLRLATPYNTYTNSGLPPTPIALSGREAISASLHPDQSDKLYFVAKGDGSHYFSSTLEEHNQAVRQYQIENRAQNYSSQPQ